MLVKKLPKVKRMGGAKVDMAISKLVVQYLDEEGNTIELEMPIGDAMYLLSLLKAIQLDLDFPFPDDPRDPKSPVIKPSLRLKDY